MSNMTYWVQFSDRFFYVYEKVFYVHQRLHLFGQKYSIYVFINVFTASSDYFNTSLLILSINFLSYWPQTFE